MRVWNHWKSECPKVSFVSQPRWWTRHVPRSFSEQRRVLEIRLLWETFQLQQTKDPVGKNLGIFSPTRPHINCETNSPHPIINVVCKYLRLLFPYAPTLSRGGRDLISFGKLDHSKISINFSRNWVGLNNCSYS